VDIAHVQCGQHLAVLYDKMHTLSHSRCVFEKENMPNIRHMFSPISFHNEWKHLK